uniref:Uncharacterized protein n=1 Tax=Meloidogyne enterolobii TaxID=390850 RepID=A0A6V7TU22_MELEN|nr:unnamed protein product [Meloidogyne enterolobii]
MSQHHPNHQNIPSNIPFQLNIVNSTNTSIPSFNYLTEQQPNDVYEFNDSPEEDKMAAPMTSNYFQNVSPSISTSFNQYKSPITASPSFSTTPKRIKTAMLAKKLVAAAAVESSSSANKLNLVESLPESKPETVEFCQKIENQVKREEHHEKEGTELKIGNELKMEGSDEIKQQPLQQPHRAYSFTCGGVQEQKKVPPLRISLIKTPSEDGESQPVLYSPVSSVRKTKRATGGRSNTTSSKKEEMRRVTRSRVRQTNNLNDGDDNHQQPQPYRKRPKRTLENYNSSNIGFLEEEDASSAAEGGCEDNLMIDEDENDEQKNEENSQHSSSKSISEVHSASRSTSISALASGKEQSQQNLENEKNNGGNDASNTTTTTTPSVAATLFAKNSFEQSICYETMMHNKWTQNYVEHLAFLIETMQSTDESQATRFAKTKNFSSSGHEKQNNEICKDLPEVLKKLFLEQEKRRHELAEEHNLDKERITQMAEREMCRIGADRKKQLFPVVSCLRDFVCHDPTLLSQSMQNLEERRPRMCTTPSINQFKQRFNKLVNTTKNRHLLEAQSLMEVQKADWHRTALKLQKEQEQQQQLLLKGLINTSKKQQSIIPQILFPPDLWVEKAVKMVEITNAQLPQFK